MGWGNCGEDSNGRPIGYCHAARCDHPGCKSKIDRGLAYACGGMHGTQSASADDMLNDVACEGYFCGDHLQMVCLEHEDGAEYEVDVSLCFACAERLGAAYREHSDWRAVWPTDAPPLPPRDRDEAPLETRLLRRARNLIDDLVHPERFTEPPQAVRAEYIAATLAQIDQVLAARDSDAARQRGDGLSGPGPQQGQQARASEGGIANEH